MTKRKEGKGRQERNGGFWGGDGVDKFVDFPLELRQDPLQGHLGPQEGGRRGGEHINFLPFRSSSFGSHIYRLEAFWLWLLVIGGHKKGWSQRPLINNHYQYASACVSQDMFKRKLELLDHHFHWFLRRLPQSLEIFLSSRQPSNTRAGPELNLTPPLASLQSTETNVAPHIVFTMETRTFEGKVTQNGGLSLSLSYLAYPNLTGRPFLPSMI